MRAGDQALMAELIDESTVSRYYVRDSSNNRFKAFAVVGSDGMLEIDLRTRLEDGSRSTVLRGAEQFGRILRHFAGRFKGIRGNWQFGDNLAAFNWAIKAGSLPAEAALQTWTGRQAQAAGFSLVENLRLSGKPGAYTDVRADFLPQIRPANGEVKS